MRGERKIERKEGINSFLRSMHRSFSPVIPEEVSATSSRNAPANVRFRIAKAISARPSGVALGLIKYKLANRMPAGPCRSFQMNVLPGPRNQFRRVTPSHVGLNDAGKFGRKKRLVRKWVSPVRMA